MVEAPQPPL